MLDLKNDSLYIKGEFISDMGLIYDINGGLLKFGSCSKFLDDYYKHLFVEFNKFNYLDILGDMRYIKFNSTGLSNNTIFRLIKYTLDVSNNGKKIDELCNSDENIVLEFLDYIEQ